MAHQYFNDNHGTSFVNLPSNNQFEQNNYDYEWRKTLERERQIAQAQAQVIRSFFYH